MTAAYRLGEALLDATGVGNRDQNWGNASVAKIVHDRYWAGGQADPYPAPAVWSRVEGEQIPASSTVSVSTRSGGREPAERSPFDCDDRLRPPWVADLGCIARRGCQQEGERDTPCVAYYGYCHRSELVREVVITERMSTRPGRGLPFASRANVGALRELVCEAPHCPLVGPAQDRPDYRGAESLADWRLLPGVLEHDPGPAVW